MTKVSLTDVVRVSLFALLDDEAGLVAIESDTACLFLKKRDAQKHAGKTARKLRVVEVDVTIRLRESTRARSTTRVLPVRKIVTGG